MAENYQMSKHEKEDKIRCAAYLLEMYEKYGAEILAEKQEKGQESNGDKR